MEQQARECLENTSRGIPKLCLRKLNETQIDKYTNKGRPGMSRLRATTFSEFPNPSLALTCMPKTSKSKVRTCSDCGIKFSSKCHWSAHAVKSPLLKTPKLCADCPAKFSRKSCFVKHWQIHPIKCPQCTTFFHRKWSFDLHLTKHKNGTLMKPGLECNFCHLRLPNKSSMEHHIMIHHTKEKPYKCKNCPYACTTANGLSEHTKRKHTVRERTFKCDVCEIYFYDQKNRDKHAKNVHGLPIVRIPRPVHSKTHADADADPKTFECPMECGAKYKSAFPLQAHIQTHTGERPHGCDLCQKTFRTLPTLKRHHETHAEPTFECSTCSKRFRRKANLRNHEKVHEVSAIALPINCTKCFTSFSEFYQWRAHVQATLLEPPKTCRTCNQAFDQRLCYRNHIKTHPAPCTFCSKLFTRLADLELHEQKHQDGKLARTGSICTFCGKDCGCPSELEVHFRRHTGEKPFKCSVRECSKSFEARGTLNTHVQIYHNPDRSRNFHCEQCGKSFFGKQVLKRHSIGHTTVGKPFECKFCNARFGSKDHVRQHLRVHTNERPYPCLHPQCGKQYKAEQALRLHTARKHGGIPTHSCDQCAKKFFTEASLKVHLGVHSGARNFSCSICGKKFIHSQSARHHEKTIH